MIVQRRAAIAAAFQVLLLSAAALAANAPDLRINGERLSRTLQLDEAVVPATSCAAMEKCVSGPGKRLLLRFSTGVINSGNADFVLGAPAGNGQFEHSACHDHFHVRGLTRYEILDPRTFQTVMTDAGALVGRKQGFCLRDTQPIAGPGAPESAREAPTYDCEFQGISAGWEDLYEKDLDCQWLDITGIRPGSYLLRITVNPDFLFHESDYTNNDAFVRIEIP